MSFALCWPRVCPRVQPKNQPQSEVSARTVIAAPGPHTAAPQSSARRCLPSQIHAIAHGRNAGGRSQRRRSPACRPGRPLPATPFHATRSRAATDAAATTTHHPISRYTVADAAGNRPTARLLNTTPAIARPHTTPSSVHPAAPRIDTSMNGVYVPAISR